MHSSPGVRPHVVSAILFVGLTAAALLAACGGGAPEGPRAPTAQTSTAPQATGANTSANAPSAPEGHMPASPMKPIFASTMADDLKKIGLDATNLPPLGKLEPEKLRKVMKSFNAALGVKCTGCHEADDYRAPTPAMRITSKMWDIYVRGFTQVDGSVLYCDSCHDGKLRVLDRHDRQALAEWMCTNYVEKLNRIDKKDNSCETCHGEPYRARFLSGWTK